jgi:transcriptional regulator with XRE-family HTH domain
VQEASPGVGAFVRLARTRTGKSQRKLSEAIGRSPAYVQKLESGEIEPSFAAMADISTALNLTPLEAWVLLRVSRHTRLLGSRVADETTRTGVETSE